MTSSDFRLRFLQTTNLAEGHRDNAQKFQEEKSITRSRVRKYLLIATCKRNTSVVILTTRNCQIAKSFTFGASLNGGFAKRGGMPSKTADDIASLMHNKNRVSKYT